jgi:Rrf2 family protein
MKVSAKAEYACFAMLELAANYRDPQPQRVKDIADAHGISQRFLVQILLQLKSAGLVTSVRGAAGGYQLARPPTEVSLADVIGAIERPTPRPTPPASDTATVQAVRGVWKRLQEEEQRRLAAISLADLARRIQESSALSYQI